MSGRVDHRAGWRDQIRQLREPLEPHEISIHDVEVVAYICAQCGEPVNVIDGETAEHVDPALNPRERASALVLPIGREDGKWSLHDPEP